MGRRARVDEGGIQWMGELAVDLNFRVSWSAMVLRTSSTLAHINTSSMVYSPAILLPPAPQAGSGACQVPCDPPHLCDPGDRKRHRRLHRVRHSGTCGRDDHDAFLCSPARKGNEPRDAAHHADHPAARTPCRSGAAAGAVRKRMHQWNVCIKKATLLL